MVRLIFVFFISLIFAKHGIIFIHETDPRDIEEIKSELNKFLVANGLKYESLTHHGQEKNLLISPPPAENVTRRNPKDGQERLSLMKL